MNLQNHIKFIRKLIKPLTVSRLNDSDLTVLVNKAKDDVAARLLLYKKHKDFDIEADVQSYNLSTIASDYLAIDTSGVWWKNSNDEWDDLDPYTKALLGREYPDWLNHSSSDPLRYYIETDLLVFDPTPDTDYTNGGRIYYGAKPPDMADNAHFPFPSLTDQEVEIPQFSILDECIWAYIEWWCTKVIKEDEDTKIAEKRKHYTALIEEKRIILYGRADVFGSQDMLMRGPKC